MSEYNEFQTQSGVDAGESKFTFGDIIHMILGNWYWYVLSIAFFLACGVLYLLRTSPVYQRNATVLVKDARKGSGTEVLAFNDIMSGMTRRSVDNELYIFQSRRLMEQVVKKHNLSTIQTCPNKLRTVDLYGREPLLVEFITAGSEDKGMFHYTITKEGSVKTGIVKKIVLDNGGDVLVVSNMLCKYNECNGNVCNRNGSDICAVDFFKSAKCVEECKFGNL